MKEEGKRDEDDGARMRKEPQKVRARKEELARRPRRKRSVALGRLHWFIYIRYRLP